MTLNFLQNGERPLKKRKEKKKEEEEKEEKAKTSMREKKNRARENIPIKEKVLLCQFALTRHARAVTCHNAQILFLNENCFK